MTMSPVSHSRRICYVHDKSVKPPIAGKVFERQCGRSEPGSEVPAARQVTSDPKPGCSKASLTNRGLLPSDHCEAVRAQISMDARPELGGEIDVMQDQ